MQFGVFLLYSLVLYCLQSFAADICLLNRLKAIRLRNRYFFTVGDFVYPGNNVVSPFVRLQYLDLDETFSVAGNIPASLLRNTTSTTHPGFTGDAFWTDANETVVYTVGQTAQQAAAQQGQANLDAYDVQNDVWLDVDVSGGAYDNGISLSTMYASSSTGGMPLSFISGGGAAFADGLVIFNSTDPRNPTWTNVTNSDLPYFKGPHTEYMRYGSKGILVVLGGYINGGDNSAFRKMNSIQIYDIDAGKWFTQVATGDIPPSTGSFCTAVTAAPDDSSMQLILYGGWLNETGQIDEESAALAGVYSLVMPAFQWLRINTTESQDAGAKFTDVRVGQSCTTYRDRQMLVFGGKSTDNDSINCSDNFSPLRMLDLTTFQWQTQWPLNDTTYHVPQAVVDIVGGGPLGNAKAANTWQQVLGDNTELFSKTVPRYDPEHPSKSTASSTTSSAINTATSTSASRLPDSGLSKGAIAGIVIGGVIGFALIVAATKFLILQSRRRRAAGTPQPRWHKPELGAEPGTKERHKVAELTTSQLHEMASQQHKASEVDGQNGGRVEVSALQSPLHERRFELSG